MVCGPNSKRRAVDGSLAVNADVRTAPAPGRVQPGPPPRTASAGNGDYKNLLEAERAFRDLPACCRGRSSIGSNTASPPTSYSGWLALLLVRVAERRTGMTWRRINTELSCVHAVTLTGSAGTAVHTTPLTTVQVRILRDCHVPATATVTALNPA